MDDAGHDPGGRVDLARGLTQIWHRHRSSVLARVQTLENGVAALIADQLTAEMRDTALGAAHALHGTAGTFGFARASEIARQLETALADTERRLPAIPELRRIVRELRAELEGEPRLRSIEAPPRASLPADEAASGDR
jgi:HPt (histidine-containing phosphotransfer) domain-containing protein